MADQMPEGLRKHFEKKNEGKEAPEKGEKDAKGARLEALRKAKKAKAKRKSEKEGSGRWFRPKNAVKRPCQTI